MPLAKQVLDTALAAAPRHLGLCHLYIHLMEMSPDPAAAAAQCDVLREAGPIAAHVLYVPA